MFDSEQYYHMIMFSSIKSYFYKNNQPTTQETNGETAKQVDFNSFRNVHKSFDNQLVVENLYAIAQFDKYFFLKTTNEFKYVARRYQLKNFDLDVICKCLIDPEIDSNMQVSLGQALKYSIRNGSDIDFEELLKVLEKVEDSRVKNEIMYSLGYKIMNLNESISIENKIPEIENLIFQENNSEGKTFLEEQIEKLKSKNTAIGNRSYTNYGKIDKNSRKFLNINHQKAVVTKTQQKTKCSFRNSVSEESAVKILSLANALKSKAKKIKVSSNAEVLPTLPEEQGDDRSCTRGSYTEAINLYELVKNGQLLKSDDKDNWLKIRFIGPSKKWYVGDAAGSFFTDRLIASIYLMISKNQKINSAGIDLLMNCMVDLDELKHAIFESTNDNKIAESMVCRSIIKQDYKDAPKIIADIAQRLLDYGTTEIEFNWLGDYKFKYYTSRINEILDEELNQIRLDAAGALYNSALRDRSILTDSRLKKLQNCLTFTNPKFKSFMVKFLSTLGDNKTIDYANLFMICLNQIENKTDLNESINFINQQTKDENRCKELFSPQIISKLSDLAQKSCLDDKTKQDIFEIINNCLEFSFCQGLIEKDLKNCIYLIENTTTSKDLVYELLKTVLLTAEKDKNLPNSIVSSLITKIDDLDETSSNFILMILATIYENLNPSNIFLNEISSKLLNDLVIVSEQNTIRFETRTSTNVLNSSISSVAALIFSKKIESFSYEESIPINTKTFDHMISALNSNEKLTRILIAKCIYQISFFHTSEKIMDDSILLRLRDYTDDKVIDVSIYCIAAYVKGLSKLDASLVSPSHIEFLSTIYVYEDLRLEQKNFTDEVNANILNILLNQSKIKELSRKVFTIFDHVLIFDEKRQETVIQIIYNHTSRNYLIPSNHIYVIENALGNSEVYELTLKVIVKMIENGQEVSNKTLQIFVDNLYLSDSEHIRKNSFNILDKASENQDLSDEIFDKLELERAGNSIGNQRPDINFALSFLLKQTKDGSRLSINTFISLRLQLKNKQKDIITILNSVSSNKQIIPGDLLEELEKIFDPYSNQNEIQSSLIEIFSNISKNNQNISPSLIAKLEEALKNKNLIQKSIQHLLSILALQVQRGHNLSFKILNRMCDEFLIEHNRSIKREILSAFCYILQKNNNNDLTMLRKVLISGLKDKIDPNVLNDCLRCFKLIIAKKTHDFFNEECVDSLIEALLNAKCSENNKKDINDILKSIKLDRTQSNKLKLALLNTFEHSNAQYLNEIETISKEVKIFENNFKKIQQIIDQEFDLTQQLKAIKILDKCSNKKDISIELLKSIITLMASTNCNLIKKNCCQLISKSLIDSEHKLDEQSIEVILGLDDKDLVIATLKVIRKNQNISKNIEIYLKLLQADVTDEIELEILFKELILLLSSEQIAKLPVIVFKQILEIQLNNNDSNQGYYFLEIFSLLIGMDENYCSEMQILNTIEEFLLQSKKNETKNMNLVIKAYYKIIQSNHVSENLVQIIELLADQLEESVNKNENEESLILLFKCISSAAERIKILDKGFFILENNIESQDPMIRCLSYKGLISQHHLFDKRSVVFVSWFYRTIANFESNIMRKIEPSLELIEILISLEYIDFDRIMDTPDEYLYRELLLTDLLSRYKISSSEQFNFYKNWLAIEQLEHLKNGKSDLILKLVVNYLQSNNKIDFLHVKEILLIFLKVVDLETIEFVFTKSSMNCYTELKRQWVKHLLSKRFLANQINFDYLNNIALKMITNFSTNIIEKLLNSVTHIENLKEFEILIEFASKNHIKDSDIYVQNASIQELKRSIEIKLLESQVLTLTVDRSMLINTLNNLFEKNWTYEYLKEVFSFLKVDNLKEKNYREKNLMHIIEIIDQYKISVDDYSQLLNILQKESESWIKLVNNLAIKNNFQMTRKIKSGVELIEELYQQNDFTNIEMTNNLQEKLEKIKSQTLKSSFSGANEKNIAEWNKIDVKNWAKLLKSNKNQFNQRMTDDESCMIEALAVIKQANFLETGFHLTDIQILSCLIALGDRKNRGRLLQVSTGEGKSTIVCVLAIIFALRGNQVDIITSSPVLAERDAKEKKSLFSIFDLSCDDNNDKSIYIKGSKSCYKKDIVYGEASQFQFDTLRDEYSQLKTLAGRKFQVAIVDEVDSMLIDDSSKIARLATTVAGIDQLQPIYYYLWQRMLQMHEKIIEVNGKMYLLYGKISFNADKIVLEFVEENSDQTSQITDLQSYLNTTEDISNIGQPITTTIETFIQKNLEDYLNELIDMNVVKIPNNFNEFVKKQIKKWVSNAFVAMNYQENKHYVIHEGAIKPVDFFSTGIIQSSTNWSDGLHQMLQIKHNLKMTCETFTTNFISNMCFFKRYGSNLFGLTGTLVLEFFKLLDA